MDESVVWAFGYSHLLECVVLEACGGVVAFVGIAVLIDVHDIAFVAIVEVVLMDV